MLLKTPDTATDKDIINAFERFFVLFPMDGEHDVMDIMPVIKRHVNDYLKKHPAYYYRAQIRKRDHAFLLLPFQTLGNGAVDYDLYLYKDRGQEPLSSWQIQHSDRIAKTNKRGGAVERFDHRGIQAFARRFLDWSQGDITRNLTRDVKVKRDDAIPLFNSMDHHCVRLRRTWSDSNNGVINGIIDDLISLGVARTETMVKTLYESFALYEEVRFGRLLRDYMGVFYNEQNRLSLIDRTERYRNCQSYNALTLSPKIEELCKIYPIALSYMTTSNRAQEIAKSKEAPFEQLFGKRDNNIRRLLKTLTEGVFPANALSRLSEVLDHIEGTGHDYRRYDNTQWQHAIETIDFAKQMAITKTLGRSSKSIFKDLTDRSQLSAYAILPKGERDTIIQTVRAMVDRVGFTMIVPLLMGSGLPFPIAAALATSYSPSKRHQKEMKRLTSGYTDTAPNLAQVFLDRAGMTAEQIIEAARRMEERLPDNSSQEERAQREAIFANPSQYGFPVIPAVTIQGLSFMPIENWAKLLMSGQETGHTLWHNPEALLEEQTYITQVVDGKIGDPLTIMRMHADETGVLQVTDEHVLPPARSYNDLGHVVKQYLDLMRVPKDSQVSDRHKRQKLTAKARQHMSPQDYIGHDPDFLADNQRAVRKMAEILNITIETGSTGCINHSVLNDLCKGKLGHNFTP